MKIWQICPNITNWPIKGGGQTFFRAFINSELGPPEVAPCMARTFGEFLDIGAEPAQSHAPPKYGAKNSHISQMVLEGQDGYQTVRRVLLIKVCPPPPLTHEGSILEQNDLGLREIFLEFNYGSFSKKMESVGLSCQKLVVFIFGPKKVG